METDDGHSVAESETVALVKDTFEFCGNVVPIGMASDEHRIHKTKSGLTSILRRYVASGQASAKRGI